MIGVYQVEELNLYPIVDEVIRKHLHMNTQDAGVLTVPENAYNPLRQQYDARTVVKALAEHNSSTYDFKIGFVDVDIYISHMNFIFGLADSMKRTALVSTFRLAGAKLNERVAKETIHELGHLKGLQHCANETCVMHFSNTLDDTDTKKTDFCPNCRGNLG